MRYRECFDGLERAPAPFVADCSHCALGVTRDLWDFVDNARPGYRLSDTEVQALGLCRAVKRGMTSTTVFAGGPTAYVGRLRCPACEAATVVVVGLDEFQPSRWIGGVLGPDP